MRGIVGDTVLVTGAARGLGAGIARAMAEAGAAIVLADRDVAGAERVAALCGGRAIGCDVTDEAAVVALFAVAGPVDVLVCAAGVTRAETVDESTLAQFEQVLRVNVSGTFLCCRAAFAGFRARGTGGRIILLGSVVGHQGALRGHVAYAASKGAVHSMAKTLARTGAPLGVTVNVVAPGVVETEMSAAAHGAAGLATLAATMPLGRLQQVADIAAACVYLAGPSGADITGAVLDVNGGMLMR